MRFWPRKFVKQERTTVGAMLCRMGCIKQDDLEQALIYQTESHKQIGEILIDMGFISREDLARALMLQRKMRNGGAADAMLSMVEEKSNRRLKRLQQVYTEL